MRPAAHLPSFASPKERRPRKGDPAARVPHRPVGRWGQPAMLGPGVHRGTRCVLPAGELRSDNRGESDNDARVLRHALTPGPALLGTVRRGWERAPLGPLLRSACGPSLRSASQSERAQPVGSPHRARHRPKAQLRSSSRVDPAPHPCWLRREAQGLGWVRVPKDTRTSCSGLPMLFERSSKNAASSSAPPQARASQVAPVRPTGRTGDADWGSPFLGPPSFGDAKEGGCAAGRTPRPQPLKQACSNHSTRSVKSVAAHAMSRQHTPATAATKAPQAVNNFTTPPPQCSAGPWLQSDCVE